MVTRLGRAALIACACLACAACGTTDQLSAQEAAQYAAQCEKQGHKPDSASWRSCIQSADLNAALARQREYDRKLLRQLDCVDPRFAC